MRSEANRETGGVRGGRNITVRVASTSCYSACVTVRRASWIFTLASVSLAGCSSKPSEVAPFREGSVLVYEVSDDDGTYDLTLSFSPQSSGFNVTAQSPRGTRTMRVDHVTAPLKGEATESQRRLADEGVAYDQFYLPTPSRKIGAVIAGGRVMEEGSFQSWTGFRVGSVMPMGFRFYDKESGLLVGWAFEMGLSGISGRLKESR